MYCALLILTAEGLVLESHLLYTTNTVHILAVKLLVLFASPSSLMEPANNLTNHHSIEDKVHICTYRTHLTF